MSRVVSLKRVDDKQFHDSHSPDLILLHHGLTSRYDPNTLQKVYVFGEGANEEYHHKFCADIDQLT